MGTFLLKKKLGLDSAHKFAYNYYEQQTLETYRNNLNNLVNLDYNKTEDSYFILSNEKTNTLQNSEEDGTLLLNETNGSIITENFSVSSEPIDNADFDNLVTLEGILDFSEKNPFGEIGA